jgi:hypothetical protein
MAGTFLWSWESWLVEEEEEPGNNNSSLSTRKVLANMQLNIHIKTSQS